MERTVGSDSRLPIHTISLPDKRIKLFFPMSMYKKRLVIQYLTCIYNTLYLLFFRFIIFMPFIFVP